MIIPQLQLITKKLSVEFGFKKSILNPLSLYYFNKYHSAVCQNNIKLTFQVIRKIHSFDKKLAYHLLAQFLVLHGKFKLSLKYLNQLLFIQPNHTSSIYLKAKCLEALDQKDEAIQALIQCTKLSNRKKTWLIWANIITSEQDFENYWQYWQKKNTNTQDWDLINYLITAALRSKQYDHALKTLDETYQKVKSNQIAINSSKSFSSIPQKNAELALKQINEIFQKNDIDFFLISGTLLGLIRENQILGHDKDLDIGIWNSHDIASIKALIYEIGTFEILPVRSPKVLRVRHFSNVCIDIFIHEIKNDKILHGGVKSIWENSFFTLRSAPFLNGNYLIPENFENYLNENYGNDWRIPKVEFDSSIDTPNITITNVYEMIAYCYQKLFICHAQGNTKLYNMYLDQINHYKKSLPSI